MNEDRRLDSLIAAVIDYVDYVHRSGGPVGPGAPAVHGPGYSGQVGGRHNGKPVRPGVAVVTIGEDSIEFDIKTFDCLRLV